MSGYDLARAGGGGIACQLTPRFESAGTSILASPWRGECPRRRRRLRRQRLEPERAARRSPDPPGRGHGVSVLTYLACKPPTMLYDARSSADERARSAGGSPKEPPKMRVKAAPADLAWRGPLLSPDSPACDFDEVFGLGEGIIANESKKRNSSSRLRPAIASEADLQKTAATSAREGIMGDWEEGKLGDHGFEICVRCWVWGIVGRCGKSEK